MIKITSLAILALLVIVSLSGVSFIQAQASNTTEAATTTTVVATTTTATPAPETVSFQWGTMPIYPGNNNTLWITLSKMVPFNQTLTIKFWNSDPNFFIQDLTLNDQSSSSQMVYYWATGAPANNMNYFFFDMSLQGTGASSYALQQQFANISYSPKLDLTISYISNSLWVGQSFVVWANISKPLPGMGDYVQISAQFDSRYITITPSMQMIQGNVNTAVSFNLTAIASTAGTMGTNVTFMVEGMAYNIFNSHVMGGTNGKAIDIMEVTTTTAATTTLATTTTTMAASSTLATTTTTQAPPQTTTTGAPMESTTTTMAPMESTTTQPQQTNGTQPMTETTVASTTTSQQQTEPVTSTTAAPTTTQQQQTTAAPTTTTQQQQTTAAQTTAAPTTTTEVSINPKTPPPGWLVIKRKNLTPLTDSDKQSIRNSLSSFLNFPSNLITVGQVDAAGNVIVVLETSAAVDQAAVNAAIAEVKTFNTTQLNALGAASVEQGTLAPTTMAAAEDEFPVAVVAGAAGGGVVLIIIILIIIKKNSSGGDGQYLSDDRPGDQPMLALPQNNNMQAKPVDTIL